MPDPIDQAAAQPAADPNAAPVVADPVAVAAPRAPVEDAPPAAPAEPVYDGLKKIASQDELLAYTQELERKNLTLSAENQGMKNVKEPVAPLGNFEPAPLAPTDGTYADRLFSNPDETVRDIKAETRQEIMAELDKKDEEKQRVSKFWSEFFVANTDLQNVKEVVDMALQNNPKLGELPVEQAKAALAMESRQMLKKIRGDAQPADTLTNAAPVAMGASGQPTAQPPVVEETSSFVDQLNEMRQSKM